PRVHYGTRVDGAMAGAFFTYAALVGAANLLIIDELGYVPLSQTGAKRLFEVFCLKMARLCHLLAGRGVGTIVRGLIYRQLSVAIGGGRIRTIQGTSPNDATCRYCCKSLKSRSDNFSASRQDRP
ncbi:MAG TPA: hypothetical protein VIK28_05670, partial [Sedimentisphaerales bacterium]